MSFVPHLVGLALVVFACGAGGCASRREAGPEQTRGPREIADRSSPALASATQVPAASTVGLARNGNRNAYVLLSGGGTPLTNNYSQYLQARAMADFFARECPPDRTWVFFGVGNRKGEPPILGDTRREQKRDGAIVQSWEAGILPRNRPATRASFLRALREEILPVVREGGTLYLFVGDHGELAGRRGERESAITMWQMKQQAGSGDWYTDDDEVLKVSELRAVLTAGLGAGQVVFGMTQCHGGGFHELGIAREMNPPRRWFNGAPPAWAAGDSSALRLRVAGFTATDQASPAAGCDPDPDPERWVGYERYLPESLLGIDLMSGERKGRGARSLAEAHAGATRVDQTIDKPRSTSDHWLEAWARLIEKRLAEATALAPDVAAALARFQRLVDGGVPPAADPALNARWALFDDFTRELVHRLPESRELLLRGTRQQLESALRTRDERGPARGSRRNVIAEQRRNWSETLRPAWQSALRRGAVTTLTATEREFEQALLKVEDEKKELMFPRGGDDTALLNELYWASGYADAAGVDRRKAEEMARWAAERRARIVAWGQGAAAADVRAAAEKIGPGPRFVEEPARPLSRRTAVERVLFYRRVLAAWDFLLTVDAREALRELAILIAIEETPVRPDAT